MTTATDTDIQQLKDLIIATQKQITDGSAAMQKLIADLTLEMKVGFTKLEGDIETLSSSVQNFEYLPPFFRNALKSTKTFSTFTY